MNPDELEPYKNRYKAPKNQRAEVLDFWKNIDLNKFPTYALVSAKKELELRYRQYKSEPPRAIDFL